MADSTDSLTAAAAALSAALAGPAKVTGDAGAVEQYPLVDLIAAHRYLAELALGAAGTRTRGLRFNRLIPDGTVLVRSHRFSSR